MRMPTCAYEIGDVTVDKEGGVTCDDADKLERIIHSLIADGFTPVDTCLLYTSATSKSIP